MKLQQKVNARNAAHEINTNAETLSSMAQNTETGIAINRNHKDTVFRMLFSEKENLLSLYNAVSGRNYSDIDKLEIVTLDNAIYMNVKNDIAYLIDFEFHMLEHQSTVNPNMPFRFLQYVTAEFEKLTVRADIYGSRAVKLPTPHFLVFYNGTTKQPETITQNLSELYEIHTDVPELELKVKVLNINSGYNEDLKNNCIALKDYMRFVERIRQYGADMPIEQAVDRAVDTCIDEGILKEFLLKNKSEVKRMSIFEYDEEAHLKSEREIWREEGIEIGRAEGRAEGMTQGMEIGLAQGIVRSIIELLEELGDIPDALRVRLESETDAEQLSRLLKLAAKAKDIQDFIEEYETFLN